ncbi:MAG: MOSC domain-containing protein [Aeoliella sp.]
MKLLSVNVGRPRLAQYNGQTLSTAIFKQPAAGAVQVTTLGLAGDDQADKSVHGGIDKAVYVYTEENYQWWREQLDGRELPPGEFGENFLVSGMTDDLVGVGDVYRIGTALVQVTQPRTPCLKLGLKMKQPTFVKQFHLAARTGFYLRVLEEGTVEVGDTIALEQTTDDRMTIAELYQQMFFEKADTASYKHASELAGLSDAWRKQFLEKT